MNPSKRKWLARLEQAAKAKEVAKAEEPVVQPVVVAAVEQPVVEEIAETPVVTEEAPAPVVSSKKKRS